MHNSVKIQKELFCLGLISVTLRIRIQSPNNDSKEKKINLNSRGEGLVYNLYDFGVEAVCIYKMSNLVSAVCYVKQPEIKNREVP